MDPGTKWSSMDGWGSVENWSGTKDWGGNDSFGYQGSFVYDGVESVDWISGVVNSTAGTIRVGQGVGTLDNISVAAFNLALAVAG